MRKPVLVIGVAAMVLAGVVCATSQASAVTIQNQDQHMEGTGSGAPGPPGALPPSTGDPATTHTDGNPDPAQRTMLPHPPPAAGSTSDTPHGSARSTTGPQLVRPQAGGFAAQEPAAPAPAAEQRAAQNTAQNTAQNAARKPGEQAPRNAAEPAVRKQPARRPASDLLTAARAAVTQDDVSASPASRIQKQILLLTNRDRRAHGCGGLTIDRRLISAANAHASDMARHNYFAHDSRDGDQPQQRLSTSGYDWQRAAENLARGRRFASPLRVMDGWMRSPEHRRNILDCRLNQMGVGLAIARDHTPYWVQDFATPMP